MNASKILPLIVFVVFLAHAAHAQTDTTRIYELTLTDGTTMRGFVVGEDSLEVQFRSRVGAELQVARTAIESLTLLDGVYRKGTFYRTDPNRTRLFFAPTARTLPSKSGYFSIYQIFFPMIAVGVTDWLTLSGGMSLLPGASNQLFYAAPKIRAVHTETFDLSGGVLYMGIPGISKPFGIIYGVGTAGSSTAALTMGLGWGFYGDDTAESPTLVVGGELQVSESTKFLSENWFPTGSDFGIISIGIRFFGEHLAGDFGLMTTTESSSGFPFLPWVGFVYNF